MAHTWEEWLNYEGHEPIKKLHEIVVKGEAETVEVPINDIKLMLHILSQRVIRTPEQEETERLIKDIHKDLMKKKEVDKI